MQTLRRAVLTAATAAVLLGSGLGAAAADPPGSHGGAQAPSAPRPPQTIPGGRGGAQVSGSNAGGWISAPGRPARAAPAPPAAQPRSAAQPVAARREAPRNTHERVSLAPLPAGAKPPPKGRTAEQGNWFYPDWSGGPGPAPAVWIPAPPRPPARPVAAATGPAPQAVPAPVAPPAPQVDPAALAELAFRQVALDPPAARTAPDPSVGSLVNLPTWLWADPSSFGPRSLTVTAGAVSVTVSAVPTALTFAMGDGTEVACDGPGVPFDLAFGSKPPPGACTHTYRRSSARQPGLAYQVTATTHWHVTWVASGAPGGGDLGVVPASTSLALPVAEVQAINQTPRSG